MLLSFYAALGLATTACGRSLQVPLDGKVSSLSQVEELDLDIGDLSLKISLKSAPVAKAEGDLFRPDESDDQKEVEAIKEEILSLVPDINQAVGYAESISDYNYMKPSFKLQKLLLEISESHNTAAENINGSKILEEKNGIAQLSTSFHEGIIGNSTNLIENISAKTSLIKQASLNRFKILTNLQEHKEGIKAVGKALSSVIPSENDNIKNAYVKLRDQYIEVIEELGSSDTFDL